MTDNYRLIPIWLLVTVIILIVFLCGGCFGLGGQKDYGDAKVIPAMKLVKKSEHVYKAVSPKPINVTPIAKAESTSIPPGIPVPPKTNRVVVTMLPTPQAAVAPKPVPIKVTPIVKAMLPTPQAAVAPKPVVAITPKPIVLKPIEPVDGIEVEPIEVVQIIPKMIEVPQDVKDGLARLIWYYVAVLGSLAGIYFGWRRYRAHKAAKKPVKRVRRRRKKGSSK